MIISRRCGCVRLWFILGLPGIFVCSWSVRAEPISALTVKPSAEKPIEAAPDDQDEYDTRLFLSQPDGSDIRQFANFPDYQKQGSPSWSKAAGLVAFDSWMPQKGETISQARTIITKEDGTRVRVIENAVLPSLSPGGTRVAVSRPRGGGVWILPAEDPSNQAPVQIDRAGWGTDWAPDGRLVYALNRGEGNLVIVDFVEGTLTPVFKDGASPFSQIYWNMTWSPDSRKIVCKATTRAGKVVVAIVDVSGPVPSVTTRYEGALLASFGWRSDDSRIVFVKLCPERQRYQIYWLNPNTSDLPELLPAQDELRNYSDVIYAPDGEQILFSCHKRTYNIPAK